MTTWVVREDGRRGRRGRGGHGRKREQVQARWVGMDRRGGHVQAREKEGDDAATTIKIRVSVWIRVF